MGAKVTSRDFGGGEHTYPTAETWTIDNEGYLHIWGPNSTELAAYHYSAWSHVDKKEETK